MPSPGKSREVFWSWVIMAAGGYVLAVSFTTALTVGAFFVEWYQAFGVSKEIAAMPIALNSGLMFAGVPFANMLSVRVSYRFTVMLGCVLSTIGLGLSCFATTIYWLIVTYGIFGGIGFSMMMGPSVTVLPLVFDKHLNVAAGVCSTLGGVAITLLPYMHETLISKFGWKMAMSVLTCLVAQATSFAALYFPRYIHKTKRAKSNPCRELFSFRPLCLYAASFLANFSAPAFTQLVPDFALSRGMTLYDSSMILAIMGTTSMLSRFLITVTGKCTRGKSMWMLFIGFGCRAVLMVLPAVHSYWSLVAVGMVIGVSWGIHGTVIATSVADSFGLRLLPYIVGICNFFTGISFYMGLPFAGWIFSMQGSFDTAWYVVGAMAALSGVLLLILLTTKDKMNLKGDGQIEDNNDRMMAKA